MGCLLEQTKPFSSMCTHMSALATDCSLEEIAFVICAVMHVGVHVRCVGVHVRYMVCM